MQQNSPKTICITECFLSDCPIWWQNYVNNVFRKQDLYIRLRECLLNQWNIIKLNVPDVEMLTLIFPSEEVYVQFLLTYS